ncbi:hypothetical protein H257_18925 [Aphanomyces astaci]|uniref:Uncharacterized protein n=1 Tax=Aphanomyces astaci TaxID=112090 RepID=W4FBS1_APHAT|nr:hypothetical protein H257_18925 [Aphanomyces astaci]ETV64143.1 hypothetical protein H257_18925 [Aphanomyces astaci]|eukprot:XP_009846374.1 hypothetical protein H257_18925 [Aphanomyces astaci]
MPSRQDQRGGLAFKTSSFSPLCPFISQHAEGPTQEECHGRRVQQPGPAPLDRCTSSGKLPKGVAEDMGKLFDCTPTTVRRIWRRASVDLSGSKTICASVHQRKKGQSGRKRMYTDIPERIQAAVAAQLLPLYCLRAQHPQVNPPCLLQAWRHCENWAIKHVTDIDGAKYFDLMYHTVHVDEKWFFMTRLQKKIYGAPGEKIKQRSCKSKRHLLKVMFLSAVARPRWDQAKGEWFDGKIGTWHFTEIVPAQRRSCRRDAGTPVMKTVNVTRDTYKAMIIDNVIPAIRSKWPSGETKRVKIQQDNARPHVVFQPPNSPDLNVLDLGFFRAIQTLQVEKNSSSLEEIVAATDAAWAAVSTTTLTKNFLTLQRCLQEIILDTEALTIYNGTEVHDDIVAALGLVQLSE